MDGDRRSYGACIVRDVKTKGVFPVGMLLIAASLSACQVVPSTGPLARDITRSAGRSAAERNVPGASVFDIVDVDAGSARLVSDYQSSTMNRRFGFGRGGSGGAVIGIGDELRITIFEAGIDGLFSTTDSKQTVLQVVVQPDGNAAIPYVGPVRFSGRTLEQARQTILGALKGKAVEPDVIIATVGTTSRSVTVSGAVGNSGLIPLGLKGDQITESVAKAGGPTGQPYETYVTLTRGNKTAQVLLKTILEHPSENVYVRPDDQIYVTIDPRTFTVLGETSTNNRISFGAGDLNLLEAVALAGGGRDETVDAKGYFIFRYEDREVVEQLLGRQRFRELVAKGMRPDARERYPIVYRIDLKRADSLLVGQTFPVKNRDVIYASRHPSVDLRKFLNIVSGPLSIVTSAAAISNTVSNTGN